MPTLCRGGEGDAQGATIYTLSDKASDAEAERLAEAENKADAIGGVNLTEEPTDVADILIDLAQRETRTFSNRFARLLMGEMKNTVRMHKHPLKSAGFRVLKAPDVPSVLVELGYVSNKGDLEHLVSDSWRSRTVGSMAQAIDAFLAKRLARRPGRRTEREPCAVAEALVWPQRRPYKKPPCGPGNRSKIPSGRDIMCSRAERQIVPRQVHAEENAGRHGARAETDIR